MTEQTDPKEPIDCGESAAERAGARQSSLKPEDRQGETDPAPDEVDNIDDEEDLEVGLEDSMDGSDPPSALQP